MVLPLYLAASLLFGLGSTQHGHGALGTIQGPVQFLWPEDRRWNATDDNNGPCGSPDGPKNRTNFPLELGAVSLTIADEAWNVSFSLALSNDPKSQSDFSNQVVDDITEIAPGHQCYKLEQLTGIAPGTNATIQLQYWSEEFEGPNSGKNDTFYACADITFVEVDKMTEQPSCFNVTSGGFDAPTQSTSTTLPSSTSEPAGAPSSSAPPVNSSNKLSKGAIAGIVVGSLIGALAIIAAVAFIWFRRGKATGLKGKEEYELRAQSLSNTPPASGKP